VGDVVVITDDSDPNYWKGYIEGDASKTVRHTLMRTLGHAWPFDIRHKIQLPRISSYDAFGVFGTPRSEKIGVFHSTAQKQVPISPNASYCRQVGEFPHNHTAINCELGAVHVEAMEDYDGPEPCVAHERHYCHSSRPADTAAGAGAGAAAAAAATPPPPRPDRVLAALPGGT
jgi:hypothetical protein